jgi:hypothetical protein
MDKKGSEMTMSTIVIIVIVLIVMIVLIFIFTKGSGGFGTAVSSCEDRGGNCVSDSQSCTSIGGQVYRVGNCKEGVCCLTQKEE